jgi:maltooligosyltrehalose trehalohydrolase
MATSDRLYLGALPVEDGIRFRLWAPEASAVTLILDGDTQDRTVPSTGDGYFERTVPDATVGIRYQYRLDDGPPMPDPASRYQPEGVHGPSEVIDPSAFAWDDAAWEGRSFSDLVFYELHIGTFTPEGTFGAAIDRLDYLRDLGITALNVMPVADWPGRWNWGYDQAALYAPSRAYGRPDQFRRLIDAAHQRGLAVFLDVIYNHLGPDGAYVAAFAPMFTDKHQTPWGPAINLDDRYSEGVRALFVDNALHWLDEYHLDGFRLDATHVLRDDSTPHFLAELSAAVDRLQGRPRYLVAEDHRNLNTLLRPRTDGGYGLDAVWADDFHHLIRNITAGDEDGYYAHYADATAGDVSITLEQGWFYDGKPSRSTGQLRGSSTAPLQPEQCVVCIQNHDQVGNRPTGQRLHHEIPLSTYRAASALLLLAPETPLVFMGQEWATSAPFQFFTDHDEDLGQQVTAGRKAEFEDFPGFQGTVPDPQAPETFARSRLRWEELERPPHTGIHALYRDLLRLRPTLSGEATATAHGDRALTLRRGPHLLLIALADDQTLPLPSEATVLLHTEAPDYISAGHPPERNLQDNTVWFPIAAALLARLT